MKKRNIYLLLSILSTSFTAFADDDTAVLSQSTMSSFSYLDDNTTISDEWIKTENLNSKNNFTLINNKISFSEELGLAWKINNFIRLNLSMYENQNFNNRLSFQPTASNLNGLKSLQAYSKSINPNPSRTLDTNTISRLFGYKLGVSSELGLGNNYKLGFNLNYGQLEGANLLGFNSNEINTTSFGLGIRNNKFGATLNNEIFLQNSPFIENNNLIGFEIDWHFSDETTLSFGSKQSIDNKPSTNTQNTLDSLTGNVQYIKFKHNL